MKKQYVGILISSLKAASEKEDIDTIVSTVKCGVGWNGIVEQEHYHTSVARLKPLTCYVADGGCTPLFDSVGEIIQMLKTAPDVKNPETTFLVMVVTDGNENSSERWGGRLLGDEIARLMATDRWTFTFRVPFGGKQNLVNLGIPAGNIQEWEQTERDMRRSTEVTMAATSNYFAGVKSGTRSTNSFYADASNVSKAAVKSTMTNISSEVRIWPVMSTDVNSFSKPGTVEIAPFVEKKTKQTYARGSAFYELVKPEKAVQATKLIVVRNRKDGSVYAGQSARDLLSLPTQGTIKLSPGDHGDWEIFIQSTSSNRHLPVGSKVLYWKSAGR
jgi:hypothetical protein